MSSNAPQFWQQAAGDKDRNYASICLKWGVILNGPGHFGQWPDCLSALKQAGISSRKCTDIKRFYEDMKDGDIVVLRLGTDTALAVGRIVGPYVWDEHFADIDGWDLQHVRRVDWIWSNLEEPKIFAVYSFKQGDTTQLLSSETVLEWVNRFDLKTENPLPILPPLEQHTTVKIDEISDFLFDEGVASESINILAREMGELIRIAKWYMRSENPPSESETIAYLVTPFLRALGWTPQKMAIEWNHVDIALFSQLPRSDENLSVVVEAKRKDNSCLSAVSQAEGYAQKHGCTKLIVTDGIHYGIFTKHKEQFVLDAYLNLTNLQQDYPIYQCKGAKQAVLAMTPEKANI